MSSALSCIERLEVSELTVDVTAVRRWRSRSTGDRRRPHCQGARPDRRARAALAELV